MTLTPVKEETLVALPDAAELLIKEARRQSLRRRLRRVAVAVVVLVMGLAATVVIGRSSSSTASKTNSTTPSNQIVAAPCSASALRLTDRGSDVGMSTWIQLFQFTNVSAHACSMTGYPNVTLESARGMDTTLRVTDYKGDGVRDIGDWHKGPLPFVNLAPHGGQSSFWIVGTDVTARNQPPSTCGNATEVFVTPPSADTMLVHHVGIDPFAWCQNLILVTPVLSGPSGSILTEPLCHYDLIGPTTKICKDGARRSAQL